jgi:hypothetical protein
MNIYKLGLPLLTLSSIFLTGVMTPSLTHAQKVVSINPTSNANNISPDTSISGVFEPSGGMSVNPRSVKIYLNDQDITRESTITDTFFSFKPTRPLQDGNYVVRVEYQNSQGEMKVVRWDFTVQDQANELEISSITHNASDSLGEQSTFLATIEGTTNAEASILLMDNGQELIEIPAREVSQGVYVGTYNVNQNRNGIVIGRLEKGGQTVYDAATQGFVFNDQTDDSEAPQIGLEDSRSLQPTFTNYDDGDRISTRGFTLEGQTLPNAQVAVEVSSSVPIIGGIFNVDVATNTFYEQTVTADDQGNFEIAIPAPNTITSGMKYTVRAVASQQEETSEAVQLTLVQQ